MPLAEPLDDNEARLLGVLIEKSLATPEYYPLTVSAALAAANQKNNRDPVLTLSEHEVKGALARLCVVGLAGHVVPAGSRVEKYRHNAVEVLGLDEPKIAILAELLLRGPQTKGELRQRASRMRPLETAEDLERHLLPLLHQGWVITLPPAAGSRAERFAETLRGATQGTTSLPVTAPAPATPDLASRVRALEAETERLRRQLSSLAAKLGEDLVD